MNTTKKLVILGSTGSIGQQTLDVVRMFKEAFTVTGLACGRNSSLFHQQIHEFSPQMVFSTSTIASLPSGTKSTTMEEMVSHPEVDLAVIATTGNAGLMPTLAALRAGKTVAIANKEILVAAGELLVEIARISHSAILPVDSEHCAFWQCLRGESREEIYRLLLTASGGPFYKWPQDRLSKVSPSEALAHPTWKMGKKVTIDSATLFNKGLEAIEARWLFGIPLERIEILIHRQSIVHSMIEFQDYSIKAQLSDTDMRLPIQYALFYPKRVRNDQLNQVDFNRPLTFSFERASYTDYPCLELALQAARSGGTYPAVLCAADEVAVEQFLCGALGFTEIAKIIDMTLNKHKSINKPTIEDIAISDAWARNTALEAARKGP